MTAARRSPHRGSNPAPGQTDRDAGRLAKAATLAAVTAAFGLPVWIMVSTLGTAPTPTETFVKSDIPWQVVRSKDVETTAALSPAASGGRPAMQPAIGKRHQKDDVAVAEQVSDQVGASAALKGNASEDGVFNELPVQGEETVVIAH